MAITIDTFSLGPCMTNSFVVRSDESDECWIVDPTFEPEPLIAAIESAGLTPSMAILTHGHIDHIAGLVEVVDRWPEIAIAIHEAEADALTDAQLNLSAPFGLPMTVPAATQTLTGGQTLTLAGHTFEVRHTPGHSPGGIVLYHADGQVAIVGDTLFQQSIGRYDFPTSDGPALFESIKTQLLTLPADTRILPGHGSESTIGIEAATNPYLRG